MSAQYLSKKLIKAMGWITISISIFGIFVFLYFVAFKGQGSSVGPWPILLLSMLGIHAGRETLRNTHIGKKLLALFYAIQIVGIVTPKFYIVLNVGLSLGFHFMTDTSRISINVVAFVMFIICLRILREHKHLASKPSGS
ncbi:MAG: hypothetical protein N0E54_10640 [Candidatus Thiodiazotropha taylori]|nr:hypothetical protein [Candidatus Thiodiazotropha endolucinida]MCW4229185.1 hypothetical protein [Candidatus Thiodiazotropha taylori]